MTRGFDPSSRPEMLNPAWKDCSWTRGSLTLCRQVVERVDTDAIARYGSDEEACGYLRGPLEEPLLCDEVVVLENVANKLHRLDPETYFRTGRSFFAFNEKKFDDAVTRSLAEGRPVKVLYHSHLDAGAYFSPTDAAVLSFGEPPSIEGGPSRLGPGPQWPLAFLVVSVGKDGLDAEPTIAGRCLFVWNGHEFVEAPMTIKEG